MTKRKTDPFKGAWLHGTMPEETEAAVRELLKAKRAYPVEPEPVLRVLRRQLELWRFNAERVERDPQPAQWASVFASINVPEEPTPLEVLELKREVPKRLTAHMQGIAVGELFKRTGAGLDTLFQRMLDGDKDAASVLRQLLADMVEGAKGVKGRRGPRLKADMGPIMRAVYKSIRENSTMEEVPARELAAEVLREVGINAPESKNRLTDLLKE